METQDHSATPRNRAFLWSGIGLGCCWPPSSCYSRAEAHDMHLVNFCFADERFETGLAALAADILAKSWYSNRVNNAP